MLLRFFDRLSASKYEFSQEALDYFEKYILILRNKIISLVDIIEKN